MKSVYCIRILADEKDFSIIDKLLKIVATSKTSYWEYEIQATSVSLKKIFDILHLNLISLKQIGISNKNISIWYFYEYSDQCNIEFDPIDLKLLSELNVSFCISCWEE